VVFGFVFLSPLYICRTHPLGSAPASRILGAFGSAAAAGGLVFAASAWLAALALERAGIFASLGSRIDPYLVYWFGMGVVLYFLSAGLHYAVLAVEASRDAERRAAEARTLAREAELLALRMQINPHFLFNCLHSISALATQDGVRAREMCVRLAGFLRSSLSLGGRECIPLNEELALARSYLEVEHVRYGERLRVEEEIELGCADCAAPALLLQPLIENAVKHGIAGLLEGGTIRIAACREGALVSIVIENAFDPETPAPARMGIGLAHVRRRLCVRYGDRAALEAGPSDGLYRVVLRFPCESPMASSSRA